MKLLSRLKLQFTHLNGRKFRLGFNDTVNTMCPCGADERPLKIFFWVTIAFLLKDLKFLIVFTDTIHVFQNYILKKKLLI